MIEIRGIRRTYRSGSAAVRALDDVSLTIRQGEYVAIIGPSGSGKSTLLHTIGLLDRPDSGSCVMFGRDVTGLTDDERALLRNRTIGFVFQQFHLLPRMTALDNVLLPRVYAGHGGHEAPAAESLGRVGLANRVTHMPNELSGGEQQRVAIARALVNTPAVIVADEPTGNLDSKSEMEIVGILDELNRQGTTVIMVTHETEIAAHAKRIIQMRDGKIVSDTLNGGAKQESAAGDGTSPVTGLHGARTTLRLKEHVRQAYHAMVAHKMRAVLSMLGILIGVASVIAMMAVSRGAQDSIRKSISSMGSNMLIVHPGNRRMHGVAMDQSGTIRRFMVEDAEAISHVPAVRHAAATVRGRAQTAYRNRNWTTSLQGTTTDYPEMRAATPVMGRFFTQEEMDARARVAVIGPTVLRELFGDKDPIGAVIKINRSTFRVVGVLPSKGGNSFQDWDDIIIVPLTTGMHRLLGRDFIDHIEVEVRDQALMDEAKRHIQDLLSRRLRIRENFDEAVQIRDMTEIQDALTKTSRTMSWLLGIIAAISLIVGGIGIMNIMLVSVTERTREIGLRKALGARRRDIMVQFLVESVLLTLTGGVLGMLLGGGVAAVLAVAAGWPVKVSAVAVVLSALFSAVVGLAFGMWPARQAAALDPIQALRYE